MTENERREMMRSNYAAQMEMLGYDSGGNPLEMVRVRHGRWVKMTGMMPPEYHGHYECSECQWHMKGLRNSWTREEELSYCPNCGAKMDLEEHNGK